MPFARPPHDNLVVDIPESRGPQRKLLGGSGQVLVTAEWFGHRTLGRCLFEHGCNCTDIAIIGDIKALPGGEVDHPFTI